MRQINLLAAGLLMLAFVGCTSTRVNKNAVQAITLVWQDEFDGAGLPDSNKWSYDEGDGCPNCGWGNNEAQYYTKERSQNARIESGNLVVEAHKESWKNKAFTSARLVSKHKGDWKYGRIEARLKCPSGRGTWPAFWMLSSDWKYGDWPRSGEIDIMEHVGFNVDSLFGSAHTKSFNHMIYTGSTGKLAVSGMETDFHVYAVNWWADRIEYECDGKVYHVFKNTGKSIEDWPFDQNFHVILNLAVGGNWGGEKGIDETIWPRKMLVDYVRVYAFKKP